MFLSSDQSRVSLSGLIVLVMLSASGWPSTPHSVTVVSS